MKQSKQLEWQEYIRNGVTYRIIQPVMQGIAERMAEYWGVSYTNLMGYGIGESFYWYNERQENQAVGEAIIERLNDQAEREVIIGQWQALNQKLQRLSNRIIKADLSKWRLDRLAQAYQQLIELTAEQYGIAIAIDAVDDALEQKIRECLLSATTGSSQRLESLYKQLAIPTVQSVAAKREREILALGLSLKSQGKVLSDPLAQQQIDELVERYWWMDLSWDTLQVAARQYIEAALDEILQGTFTGNQYQSGQQLRRQRQAILAELGLEGDKKLHQYLRLMDDFVRLHDWRKEFQMRELFAETLILKEMARRLSVDSSELDWLSPSEILSLRAGQPINRQLVDRRQAGYLSLLKDGKWQELLGEAARAYWEKERAQVPSTIKDLKGISASSGRATGSVLIALTAKEATGIVSGQILVTGMTTPDFVPAMKKAAAIVTDEGGITCHAAIIARELSIPCVVGTKIATRVLKNNQVVEVKANHGTVSIIK